MATSTLNNHHIPRHHRALDRIRGMPIHYDLQAFARTVHRIHTFEPRLAALGDEALRLRVTSLTAQALNGAEPSVETFALVKECARRTVGLSAFDTQLIAALGLQAGRLVEMQTGEGKTLAIVFAAVQAALTGQGVHILTFNDYLARRDAEWMGPIYRQLGLTVGVVQDGMPPEARRDAYRADVTYAAAKQVGFDLLRDSLALTPEQGVLRPRHAVIVDEADALLIDEARVPMIIAGPEDAASPMAPKLTRLVQELQDGRDYEIDREGHGVSLSEAGLLYCERRLGCGALVSEENHERFIALNCALHAEVLLKKGVDYIVRHRRVELVDEVTGRVIEDRHWPYGLQAALEAKEGLEPHPEGRILGSITVQHLLAGYPHIAGLTATARPAAEEIYATYGLETLVVPTAKPCIRIDHDDALYRTQTQRDRALIEEVQRVHRTQRPILIGTASVDASEQLARRLRDVGISPQVLNAQNDEHEAQIVAAAGRLKAVTVATNMAGRGTDIRLGGPDAQDRDRVAALGGLYVICTHRHESRRIDDQLRGRAGRQGDPGASRFFLSLEDDLVQRYGVMAMIPPRVLNATTDDGRLTSPVAAHRLNHAQRIIEGQHRQLRQRLTVYGDIVEHQRQSVQQYRGQLLQGLVPYEDLASSELTTALERRGIAKDEAYPVLVRTMLLALDRRWSDHIGFAADQRDTIAFERLGGGHPTTEFRRRLGAAFSDFFSASRQAAQQHTSRLIDTGRLHLDDDHLQGPSSTWTYLIDDTVLGNDVELLGNIGLAAGAAMYWPFLLTWALARWFKQSRRP